MVNQMPGVSISCALATTAAEQKRTDQVVPQQVVLGTLPSCRFPFGCEERERVWWLLCSKTVRVDPLRVLG